MRAKTCANLNQQGIKRQKGDKQNEKTSIYCIVGDGITSCARPAFRRSDHDWRRRSRVRISGVPIRLLPVRLQWILPILSVRVLLWAVILLVQWASLLSPPPSLSLLSVLS